MDVEVQRLDPLELITNQLDRSARCVQQTVNGVYYALVAACFICLLLLLLLLCPRRSLFFIWGRTILSPKVPFPATSHGLVRWQRLDVEPARGEGGVAAEKGSSMAG